MQHWRYFLMLEEEILSLRKYIEFEEGNYKTYSLELCKQLTSICSEIDILFKDICGKLDGGKATSIIEYRKHLRSKQDNFKLCLPDSKVLLSQTNLEFTPFNVFYKSNKSQEGKKCLEKFEKIDWWSANNDVKHDRVDKYASGNLENLLKAGSALFILNLLHGELLNRKNLIPSNNLFVLVDYEYAFSGMPAGGSKPLIFYT